LGPLRLKPALSVKEEYTDNFFQEKSNEKDDYMTTVSPGLMLQLPMGKHLFQVDYHADIIYLSEYDKYDTNEHFADTVLDLNFPGGLSAKFANNYSSTSNPPTYDGDRRKKYYQNDSSGEISYKSADRYKVDVKYGHTVKRMEEEADETDSFDEDKGEITFSYRILPKTSILLEYGLSHVDNEDKGATSTDNNNQKIWLGISWDPTAKLNGTIKGGYITKDYEEAAFKNRYDYGMLIDLSFNKSEYTSIKLTGSRRIVETAVTLEQADYGPEYVSTGGSLSFNHKFTRKVGTVIDLSYTLDEYLEEGTLGTPEGKKRKDTLFSGGIALNFKIQKWLGFDLGYKYNKKDSNFDTNDYKENRVMAKISIVF
jgi:hypothetical protein